MRSRFIYAALFLIVLLAASTAAAQPDTDTCPAVVEQALAQITQNCINLGRNSVCYGFPHVAATFAQDVPEDFFSRPADRADLFALKTLQTSPFDQTAGEWGIALLKTQANVPDTLPGQSVTFVLLGDTEVENAVEPAQANGGTPVTVTTLDDTDIWNSPGGQVIGSVPAETGLEAAAQSVDSAWLSVRSDTVTGWIHRDAVDDSPDMDALPTASQPRLSPMQAFYIRSSPGQALCEQAPSALAIHSPQGITVDLTVNGASVRLGSLILVRILPPGNILKLTTIEGLAILDAGTFNEVQVPAGWSTTRCLEEPDDLGTDGEANDQTVGEDCGWQPPVPLTPEELAENQLILGLFGRLGINEIADCPTGTTLTHVVQPGETLFRIALRYGTTIPVLAAANNLPDARRIVSGQSLIIPCGMDTGQPSLPPTPAPGTADQVDCSGFIATSPLDGLPYGTATFYWNAAEGAAAYRLNIYNEDDRPGALVASLTVERNITSIAHDLSINSIGYGFRFSWEVLALAADGSAACATARAVVPRAAPPTDVPPPPTVTPEATPPDTSPRD